MFVFTGCAASAAAAAVLRIVALMQILYIDFPGVLRHGHSIEALLQAALLILWSSIKKAESGYPEERKSH